MGEELSEEETARLIASGGLVEIRHDADWWPKAQAALRTRRQRFIAERESGRILDRQAITAKRARLKPVKTEYRRRRRS
ncbi:hypothetical protein GCM10018952_48260 [Streptosporangium vulgare]